ncbi:MAG: type IV pilin protein [Steroidobacteraceae bacterium]
MRERATRRRNAGVTLIELITVMVVIGVLTSIALPAYRNYVIRANRADAKAATLAMAGQLERCFTRFNAYDNAGCTVVLTNVPSANGTYLTSATRTATTFLVSAVPQGKQADDTGCATFRLNQANARSVSGAKGVPECWGR